MVIDVHAHIIPEQVLREVNPDESWRPRVFRDAQGKQKVDHGGKVIGSAPREFVDIDQILAEQQTAAVDVALLSPWTSLLNYHLSPSDGQRTCRLQNEPIACYVRDHPRQLAGLGIVPLQDPRLAAKEVEHVVRDLGLHGIEVSSNINGTYLGDESLLPFWEAAAALDAFILVHPVSGIGGPWMKQFDLGNGFGNPSETGLAAVSLIYSGVLERWPTLKICLSHGGGVLPYIIGRLDQGYKMRVGAKSPIPHPPSTYLRRFYFDTITHSPLALRYLIDLVGADHVLIGSDYPFDMGYNRPRDLVDSLDISPAEKEMILSATAARLLKLDHSAAN